MFPDAAVRELVGADGVHEHPVALLSFGDGEPAIAATGRRRPATCPPVELAAVYAGAARRRAGRAGRTLAGRRRRCPDVPRSDSLDEVVRRRGSQRLMDRSRTVPRELLEWPMAAAMRGIDVPHWVAVHGVDGVAPGLYRWPDLSTPLRTGDLRDELERVAWTRRSPPTRRTSSSRPRRCPQLDDRSYREAQLAAGLVEGRLHLAAYALGASASGMTFLDSEVPGAAR